VTEGIDFDLDSWAEVLVQAAAFHHVQLSRSCAGATFASSGRVRCTACDWQLAARSDAELDARARFALYAMASVSLAISSRGAP
jgi:hypothetical protein